MFYHSFHTDTANSVDYIRNLEAKPRAAHEYTIPNTNGFNVLDIADGHGTKILYIKNAPSSPPNSLGEPMMEIMEKYQANDGLRKETAQAGNFPFEIQFPYGSFNYPVPFVISPQRRDSNKPSSEIKDPYNPAYGYGGGYGGGYPGGSHGYPGHGHQSGYYPGGGYPGNHSTLAFDIKTNGCETIDHVIIRRTVIVSDN